MHSCVFAGVFANMHSELMCAIHIITSQMHLLSGKSGVSMCDCELTPG